MSDSKVTFTVDPAIIVGHDREDVAVGPEIVRFRYLTRILHWSIGLMFFVCLFSGLPIWTPIFGWMAPLFGGLQVCRWLHAWAGVAFAVFALLQFLQWARDMGLTDADRRFISPRTFVDYLSWKLHDDDIGKYNGGQKALFWMSSLGALGLFATGVVLWFPSEFGATMRLVSWLVHDVTFILFVLLILGHVYLGIAEPGTLGSMVKGTVTKEWARLNHPRWYRDVTGDKRP